VPSGKVPALLFLKQKSESMATPPRLYQVGHSWKIDLKQEDLCIENLTCVLSNINAYKSVYSNPDIYGL